MGSRGDVLVIEQDSAALEAGDADVRLPWKLAKGSLITADDPFLQLAGFERLDATHRPRPRQTIQTIQTDVGLLREQLLLHLEILVLIELLLCHHVMLLRPWWW